MRPSAMAKAIINPFTPRTMPFNVFPSIRSVRELIKGTPGIRKSTDVANASSGVVPIPNLTDNPEIIEAAKEAKTTPRYGLNRYLTASWRIKRPKNVAINAMIISGA